MSRGSRAHEQCVTLCLVSPLVRFAGPPVKRDCLENFHPGSQLTGWLGCQIIAKLIVVASN